MRTHRSHTRLYKWNWLLGEVLKETNEQDQVHKSPQVRNVWSGRVTTLLWRVIQFDAFTHTISRSQPALCYMMEINNLARSVMVQGTILKYYFTQPKAATFNIYTMKQQWKRVSNDWL